MSGAADAADGVATVTGMERAAPKPKKVVWRKFPMEVYMSKGPGGNDLFPPSSNWLLPLHDEDMSVAETNRVFGGRACLGFGANGQLYPIRCKAGSPLLFKSIESGLGGSPLPHRWDTENMHIKRDSHGIWNIMSTDTNRVSVVLDAVVVLTGPVVTRQEMALYVFKVATCLEQKSGFKIFGGGSHGMIFGSFWDSLAFFWTLSRFVELATEFVEAGVAVQQFGPVVDGSRSQQLYWQCQRMISTVPFDWKVPKWLLAATVPLIDFSQHEQEVAHAAMLRAGIPVSLELLQTVIWRRDLARTQRLELLMRAHAWSRLSRNSYVTWESIIPFAVRDTAKYVPAVDPNDYFSEDVVARAKDVFTEAKAQFEALSQGVQGFPGRMYRPSRFETTGENDTVIDLSEQPGLVTPATSPAPSAFAESAYSLAVTSDSDSDSGSDYSDTGATRTDDSNKRTAGKQNGNPRDTKAARK